MKHWKNMTKRSVALFLTLLMLLSVLPVSAFATDEVTTEEEIVESAENVTPAEGTSDEGTAEEEPAEDDSTDVEPAEDDAIDVEPAEDDDAEEDVEEPTEEAPDAIQAFLDAAAALPSAEEVTAENAEAIGEQVNAALDLYEAIEDETDEVTEALETVYAVFEAVLAAEEIPEGGTLEASGDSLFSREYHIYDFNYVHELEYGDDGWGNEFKPLKINVGVGETWVDSGVFRAWNHGDIYEVVSWDDVDVWSTNPSVLEVSATASGKTLTITYKGIADGTASVKIAFNATTSSTGTAGISGVGSPGAAAVSGCTFGTVSVGTGVGDSTVKPTSKPVVNSATMVHFKCTSYPNASPDSYSNNKHALRGSLKNDLGPEYYTLGEIVPNDGTDSRAPADKNPWMCVLTLDNEACLSLYNQYKSQYLNNKTHYLAYPDQAVTLRYYYDADGWYSFSADSPLVIWMSETEPVEKTYTVTYTDGVEGEVVFPDQGYEGLKAGDATPGFVGTPTREGYTFMGWAPAVAATVTGDVTYVATWNKLPTIDNSKVKVTKTPSKEYPVVGEEFTYTIKVENSNSTALTGVTVTDTLNEKLTFVGASDSGSYNEETRTVTWTNVTVPANGSKTVTVYVKANAAGEIKNEALATWTGGSASGNTTVTAKAKPTTYTVVHEYYTNGEKDGHTKQEKISGKNVGDTVKVDEIAKILNYADKTGYTYTRANKGNAVNSPDGYAVVEGAITELKLVDGTNIIVLRYDRTTKDPDPEWTVNWMKGYETEGDLPWETIPDTVPVKTKTIQSATAPTVPQEDYPTDSTMRALRDDSTFKGWGMPDVDETNRVITITAKWETTESTNIQFYKVFNGDDGLAAKVSDDFEVKITITDLATGAKLGEGTLNKANGLDHRICFDYVVEHGYKLTIVESNYEIKGYTFKSEATREDITAAEPTPAYSEGGMIFGSSGTHGIINTYAKKDPKIVVTKTNDSLNGFKIDPETGNALVTYTVTVKNDSGYSLYGLKLTDVMAEPKLTKKGDGEVDPAVSLTFGNWQVKKTANGQFEETEPYNGADNELSHDLALLGRDDVFADQQLVTLTYTVEIETNNVPAKIELDNKATAGYWKAPKAVQYVAYFSMARADDPFGGEAPDGTASAGSSTSGSTTGGSSGSHTEGELPAKYTVTYKWNLPDGATPEKTLPTESRTQNNGGMPAGAHFTVDTANKAGDKVTVDGTTYTFSGWTVPAGIKTETEEGQYQGQYVMPAENVVITGEWVAHKHIWDSGKVTKDPDCIHEGEKTFTCTDPSCSATMTMSVKALGHDFTDAKWVDNCISHEDADCSGHTKTCVRCNGELKDGKETQTEVHRYGAWVVDKFASLEAEGARHRECVCGHIERETIPTLDKVTITVVFRDEDGKEVGKETKVVEKGNDKTYDVKEEASKIPEGYVANGNPTGDPITGTADGNKTIIVPVTKVKYTVTYTWTGLPEGTTDPAVPETKSYVAGAEVTVDNRAKDSEITIDGKTYVFSGWDHSDFTMPAENVTITGSWTEKKVEETEKVTVTWLPGYGDNTPIKTKDDHVKGTDVSRDDYPENPTRAGYTFAGWGAPEKDADGNITITATWTPNGGNGGGGTRPRPNPTPNPGTEIDDPDVPLTDLPDENVEIPDTDVPLAELPDEDVPLAEVPHTGDMTAIWYTTAILAAGCWFYLQRKKTGETS